MSKTLETLSVSLTFDNDAENDEWGLDEDEWSLNEEQF